MEQKNSSDPDLYNNQSRIRIQIKLISEMIYIQIQAGSGSFLLVNIDVYGRIQILVMFGSDAVSQSSPS